MAQILVLEDNLILAFQIKEMLEQSGHEVTTTKTAGEALEHFEQENVDLLIADVFIKSGEEVLPEGGVKVIGTVRQLRKSKIPIIAISGSFTGINSIGVEATARTVGATVTLAKPFAPEDLVELVGSLLSQWRR